MKIYCFVYFHVLNVKQLDAVMFSLFLDDTTCKYCQHFGDPYCFWLVR